MSAPWQMSDAEIDSAFANRAADARERQIDKIVADTGMGRMQAHYHLQGRAAAIAADERRRRAASRAAVDSFRPIGDIVGPIVADIAERMK